MPASWSNPILRLDRWFSELEKVHSSWHSVSNPAPPYGRERHLDVEPPSALIELESTNRRYNLECGCPAYGGIPEPHLHISCWVRVQGRREVLDIGRLCPQSEPQRLPVLWKDGYLEVCVFEIYCNKPVLGSDLSYILFDSILNFSDITERFR